MRFAKLMVIFGLASGAAMSGAAAKDWKAVRFGMDATYAPFESVAAQWRHRRVSRSTMVRRSVPR